MLQLAIRQEQLKAAQMQLQLHQQMQQQSRVLLSPSHKRINEEPNQQETSEKTPTKEAESPPIPNTSPAPIDRPSSPKIPSTVIIKKEIIDKTGEQLPHQVSSNLLVVVVITIVAFIIVKIAAKITTSRTR